MYYNNIIYLYIIQPIKYQRCPHTETSQFICSANQLTGFHMKTTVPLNESRGGSLWKGVFCKSVTFLKKSLQHRYFPVNLIKFFRTHILWNACERLLVKHRTDFLCVRSKNLETPLAVRKNKTSLIYCDFHSRCRVYIYFLFSDSQMTSQVVQKTQL